MLSFLFYIPQELKDSRGYRLPTLELLMAG